MALFDKHIKTLNNYRNDPRIKSDIQGYDILTKKEFITWFGYTTYRRSKSVKKNKKANESLIFKLLSEICIGINHGYVEDTWGHVQNPNRNNLASNKYNSETRELRQDNFNKEDEKFDLIVSVQSGISPNASPDDKVNAINTFIVTELGECKKKPNTISVNLICSKETKPSLQGHYLMAALLCCVKASKYDKEVVLELASKYSNISGFKSYSRVGFDRDASLFGVDCFSDINNLPMSVNVAELTIDQIIDFAVNKRDKNLIKEDLGKYFYTLPRLDHKVVKPIWKTANYYHELDVNREPDESNDYKKIIDGATTKEDKKNKLLLHVKSIPHTPFNTPIMKRRRNRPTNEKKTKLLFNTAVNAALSTSNVTKRQSKKKRKAEKQTVGRLAKEKLAKVSKSQTRSTTPRKSPSTRSTQRTKPSSRSKSRGRVPRRDD